MEPSVLGPPPRIPSAAAQGAGFPFDTSGDQQAREFQPRPRRQDNERLEAIYVGHIARDVTDELLKKVLLQCGNIARWTRSRDPMTDAPASFGFCEFENPEAVWRITKLINGLPLGGSKLLVTCPQKTKELVDKWNSQRLYHLQKANPSWSPEQVEAEFAHDDQRLRVIIDKIVQDIEDMIVKNRAEREADESARLQRLVAMKSRLNENVEAKKRGRSERGESASKKDEKRKKVDPYQVPAELLKRQQIRLEDILSREREDKAQLDHLKRAWREELERLSRASVRRRHRFEAAMEKCQPPRREILQQLEADLRGVQHFLSLSFITTLGKSPLYDFDARSLLESAPREVDEDNIPCSRNWVKRALPLRAKMRESEKRDDAKDALDAEAELEKAKHREERRQEIRDRRKVLAEESETAKKPIAAINDEKSGISAAKVPDDSMIDWAKLISLGALAPEGSVTKWLLQAANDIVGATEAEELSEYILDLLPPRSSKVPTRESLTIELAELLDEDAKKFVDGLWMQLQ